MKEINQSTPVLQGKALAIGYRQGGKSSHPLHQELNVELHRGELVCLLGANGVGKSTLLRTLSLFQPALEGTLWINGTDSRSLQEKQRSHLISVVLTDKTLTGGLTVKELVALGRQPHTGFFGRLSAHDKDIIQEAMIQTGIIHKADNYMAELSDGERQKAMIAKALVQETPIILLDEPTAFLDVVSRIEVMTLLHQLAVEKQKAILLSTHDIEQALVLADRLWLLNADGLTCGVTEDLILNHQLDHLFPSEKVSFDTMHGSYYPLVEGDKTCYISAQDECLLHWGINALNRHGYNCPVLSADETMPHSDFPVITIHSASSITLYEGKTQKKCSSFESLLCVLQQQGIKKG